MNPADGHDDSGKRWGGDPFYPHHVIKQAMIFLSVVFVLVALATLLPVSLEEKADPYVTPQHIKPEWYFLAVYQALKMSEGFSVIGPWAPKLMGVIGQGLIVGLLFLFPFLDRNPSPRARDRKLALTFAVVAFLGFVGLSIWGRYS